MTDFTPEMQQKLEKNIVDLQTRLIFLEDWIEQLSDTIAKQDRELLDLNRKMQLLYQRLESADLSEGIAPFDPVLNVPPHY